MGRGGRSGARDGEGEWEVRPGGMLVQRRDGDAGPAVRLRVSHGAAFRDVAVPAQATFGEFKRVLAQATGLEPERQRLLFHGKEKSDNEFLHTAGVKDGAKLLLLEKPAPANAEQEVKPVMMDGSMMKACEAVARVRTEVDKLSAKVCDLEKSVLAGRKVDDKEFVALTELLMMQLLKLDGIEAEGEARAQRKAESLYILGARRILVAGLPPVGCLALQMTLAAVRQPPRPQGCAAEQNAAAERYNTKLQRMLTKFQSGPPGAQAVYVDIYSPLMDMVDQPQKYGE